MEGLKISDRQRYTGWLCEEILRAAATGISYLAAGTITRAISSSKLPIFGGFAHLSFRGAIYLVKGISQCRGCEKENAISSKIALLVAMNYFSLVSCFSYYRDLEDFNDFLKLWSVSSCFLGVAEWLLNGGANSFICRDREDAIRKTAAEEILNGIVVDPQRSRPSPELPLAQPGAEGYSPEGYRFLPELPSVERDQIEGQPRFRQQESEV